MNRRHIKREIIICVEQTADHLIRCRVHSGPVGWPPMIAVDTNVTGSSIEVSSGDEIKPQDGKVVIDSESAGEIERAHHSK